MNDLSSSDHVKLGRTDLAMVAAVLLWAFNFSVLKIGLREFSPMGFNGIRLTAASVFLLILLAVSGEGLRVSRRDFPTLLLMGLSGNTCYQLLFIHGLDRTSASNTAIIIASAPVFIALLSTVFRHERLTGAAWTGILISFAGFCFVVSRDPARLSFSGHAVQGDLMILAGNVFWGVYTVLSKPLLTRYSPLKLTAVTMSLGTVFFLPFSVRDIAALPFDTISLGAWAGLLFSAFFALGLCYVIWYSSVRRVGNSRTAVYDNFIPVLTVAFAWILLGERITPFQAAGAVIIIIGVWLTRTGYRFVRPRLRGMP